MVWEATKCKLASQQATKVCRKLAVTSDMVVHQLPWLEIDLAALLVHHQLALAQYHMGMFVVIQIEVTQVQAVFTLVLVVKAEAEIGVDPKKQAREFAAQSGME